MIQSRKRRRSLPELEHRLTTIPPGPGLAHAHYDLALFHDNNSREADAIPHYEEALLQNLDATARPYCLAYLASSLYKIGQLDDAKDRATEALSESDDQDLTNFVVGLLSRIERKLASA
jgi:tetratricopeptide (TPR) repeat protein